MDASRKKEEIQEELEKVKRQEPKLVLCLSKLRDQMNQLKVEELQLKVMFAFVNVRVPLCSDVFCYYRAELYESSIVLPMACKSETILITTFL